ncbi:hypothetical protein O181_132546 [Austropuccinia psidii MF-1]|uniref:Uncharacterized protein n=1 Tax=Austropuccinia psidii MF-1 TaxID=1389203 RepID=A0A9Q3L634_9BASI|nr:hypothetical protein [Austropuccinia psidii MF-1]
MFSLVSLIRHYEADNILIKRCITISKSSEAESEDSIEVEIAKRGSLFQTEKAKQPPKVQPDGCGKRRGKSFSRNTHLEDSRFSPPSPRSASTNVDVNSESELIQDNISRTALFSGGRNRNLSMPIQELVQSSQRGGVGNMPKPLAGGHELLITHQELSGSGEDRRALRRMEPIVFQIKVQKDEELVEKSKSFIHRPDEGVENDPTLEKEGPVASTSCRSLQGQPQKT